MTLTLSEVLEENGKQSLPPLMGGYCCSVAN